MLCLEIIPFCYCTSERHCLKAKQKQPALFQETVAGLRTTEAERLFGSSVQADHAVVKGSSKSMEEVTRVRHFVGSSGKERKKENGGRGHFCQPAADQRDDLQLRSRPLTSSTTKAGETDTVTLHEPRLESR